MEALSGARDIIAEWINEDGDLRARLRGLFQRKAVIGAKVLKGQEEVGSKFRDYFDWREPANKIRITSYNVCYTKLLRTNASTTCEKSAMSVSP